MEEQLREDEQELKTQEQKKKANDAKKRIRGIVHEHDKNKGTNHVQDEMGTLMHDDEQELLGLWEGCRWDDNKGGWLGLGLCAKARREDVEYIRDHKMYTRVTQRGVLT